MSNDTHEVTRYLNKSDVKTLVELGECPRCGSNSLDESWVAAIPEGALKNWECECGKEYSLPEDIVRKYE